MTPIYKADMTSSSNVVNTMVSSSGRVKTCLHTMFDSTSVSRQDELVGNDVIDWYVDSRPWELAYMTSTGGDYKKGDISALKTAIQEGADVHILIDRHGGVKSYMLAEMVHVGQNSVTAEVKSILHVTFLTDGFAWEDAQRCVLSNYLIDTYKGVQLLVYSIGSNPRDQTVYLSNTPGDVSWFISR